MGENSYYTLSEKESLAKLKTSLKGITNHEAENRLHKYGYNELKSDHHISPIKIFLEQFSSPLIWILIFALAVSIFLNEVTDAVVIGIIVVLNAILGFVQEYKAEKAIEALQKLASLKARVLREGKEVKINSKLLVPGDIIILEAGDKIPADARLLELHSLHLEEGPLTGESQPVTKELVKLAEKTSLADRKNMVYSSTTVARGRGQAVVTSTGMNTEVGKIATLIKEAHEKQTPLQKKLRELGKYLTIAVVIVAIIVFLAGILSGKSVSVMFLTAIALAVAAIPEGLPAVITISLSLGVQRMIKKNALVRKLPSVETLGSVNVICTDKTGTLTHNQMTVKKIWANETVYDVTGSGYKNEGKFMVNEKLANPEPLHKLLRIGMLCNDAKLDIKDEKIEVFGDPTEACLIVAAQKAGFSRKELNKQESRVDEIPFTSERKMMTTFHQTDKGKVAYIKGAPDIIIENCNKILINGKVQRLDRRKKAEIIKQNEQFAKDALRVLGFAYNETFSNNEEAEQSMVFVGLQAMIDPPRKEVKKAIEECHQAGIRVIMITGDQLITAEAIAKELGIKGKAVHGQDLEEINLSKEINKIGIFARVNPEHKLNIVKALKDKGYIVAMTGDGVNDAPALKKADIGISMGITGTDVAKEASDMILTDDNFTSIVSAVEEGRGIFDNIRKFVNYLLSSNLGEITAIFFAFLLGPLIFPNEALILPLTAIQILWVNLVTDGLPAVALGVDPHSKGVMLRKPLAANESILSKELRTDIIVFGVLIGIATLTLFWLYHGSGIAKAQTMAFTSLVIFEVARLHMIRSQYQLGIFSNKWLVGAVVLSILLQLSTIYTPLSSVFKTAPLALIDWGFILLAAAVLLGINKVYQYIRKKVKK
jgi:P-type Ca2+ transporter type 2C